MKESKLYRRVSTKGIMAEPMVQAHHPAMRGLWMVHVQGCLRRELENRITIDDYARVTRMNCLYCGTPPTNLTKFKCEHIPYNGVDRVDNTQAYVPDNIYACCKICNGMKSNLTTTRFLEQCRRIVGHVEAQPKAKLTSTEFGLKMRQIAAARAKPPEKSPLLEVPAPVVTSPLLAPIVPKK